MKSWYSEEWRFRISVLSLKPDDQPTRCRNGHEVGDDYSCTYGCPGEFCSKSMLKAFPIMEAVRSGGDLRNLGGTAPDVMEFVCPDGVVRFKLVATRIQEPKS